ncbi:hypothetical protein NDU88_006231 [Pleurodeles waltl]|uniref:Uncharacterized protein n=1 Tax=Pleurodeles waltl TaxID=8319 RepID=A0AAV7SNX5_PLEWA|nr:hypothetical protein NDU88_006231 [Pleurodeles waltl]
MRAVRRRCIGDMRFHGLSECCWEGTAFPGGRLGAGTVLGAELTEHACLRSPLPAWGVFDFPAVVRGVCDTPCVFRFVVCCQFPRVSCTQLGWEYACARLRRPRMFLPWAAAASANCARGRGCSRRSARQRKPRQAADRSAFYTGPRGHGWGDAGGRQP